MHGDAPQEERMEKDNSGAPSNEYYTRLNQMGEGLNRAGKIQEIGLLCCLLY